MLKAQFLILIDHMNINFNKYSFRTILTQWLEQVISKQDIPKICDIKVRAYGGWNENGAESQMRFEASKFYQQNCPALYRVSDHFFRTSFEFAESLILHKYVNPITDLFLFKNTVVKRNAPQCIVAKDVRCDEPDCELDKIRKWIRKKRACTNPKCTHNFSEVFYRQEQKQVDILLAVDLVTTICDLSCLSICVLSNDLDLVPALIFSATHHRSDTELYIARTKTDFQYSDDFLKKYKVNFLKISEDNNVPTS